MPRTLRLSALLMAVLLVLAACSGDDAEDQLDGGSESASEDTEETTPTPEAPDSLPEPTLVPQDEIDVSGLGPIVDGDADDDFDRCSIYTQEAITGLLGEMWDFGPGEPQETFACAWTAGEGEELGFVLIGMAAVDGEFDARMGDSAAGAIEGDVAIGDEFWEITGSTYGPGVAFRQGDIGVQVHMIWGTPNIDSRLAVEREAELRIAENISSRLP